MNTKRIMLFLSAALAAAIAVVGVLFWSVGRSRDYLPESAVDDIVKVLAESDIRIDPSLVSARRRTAEVYVCNSGDYNHTVAALLADSPVKDAYVVPDGEILVMENGARVEFGSDFSFRYRADGGEIGEIPAPDYTKQPAELSEAGRARLEEAATAFLDRGSRAFANAGRLAAVTTVEALWTRDGARKRRSTPRCAGSRKRTSKTKNRLFNEKARNTERRANGA